MRSVFTRFLFAGLTGLLVMACADDDSGDPAPTPDATSDTVAGTVCEQYCEAQTANCMDDNAIVFADDCATDCATWAEGDSADTAGDTANCRLYHAGVAATDGAVHCPHASPDGGGVCVD
jgi:hypothetical protein